MRSLSFGHFRRSSSVDNRLTMTTPEKKVAIIGAGEEAPGLAKVTDEILRRLRSLHRSSPRQSRRVHSPVLLKAD